METPARNFVDCSDDSGSCADGNDSDGGSSSKYKKSGKSVILNFLIHKNV